jgi:hypothetical protein
MMRLAAAQGSFATHGATGHRRLPEAREASTVRPPSQARRTRTARIAGTIDVARTRTQLMPTRATEGLTGVSKAFRNPGRERVATESERRCPIQSMTREPDRHGRLRPSG